MITERQIEIANVLIATGIVQSVYHSVELVPDDKKGAAFPVYKIGTEERYCGPDDSKKMFAYIRKLSSVTRLREDLMGSCSKSYKLSCPHRIVIFQDHTEEDFDSLIKKLLKVAFIKNVSLVSFNNNAFDLAKQESPLGDFSFDATTFYLAIDVQIKIELLIDNCQSNDCITYPNPICL